MPARDDLQYIDLADFTKGIATEYQSNASNQPTPDGFARANETWGCYGLKDGGLAALPKAVDAAHSHFDPPFIPDTSEFDWPVGPEIPPSYNKRIAVLDARLNSPVYYRPPLDMPVDHSTPPVAIHMVRQWWLATDAGLVDGRWRWSTKPVFAPDAGLASSVLKELSTADSDPTYGPHVTRWAYGWGSLMQTRSGVDQTIYNTGVPITVAAMGTVLHYDPPDPGVDLGGLWSNPGVGSIAAADGVGIHPAPSVEVVELPDLYGTKFAGMVFGHQGRVCAVTRESADFNTRAITELVSEYAVIGTNDILMWWPTNNAFAQQPVNTPVYVSPPLIPDQLIWSDDNPLADLGTAPIIGSFSPLEEYPTGIGVYHSIDANTLLLVKNVGGAVQLSGDLDRPTVVRLPGVPGVGGLANRGANTEQGFVYGSTSGVWLWSGGNTATNLAPHIDPLFWLPDDPTITPDDPTFPGRQPGQLLGSFGYRFPYLYAPNNWVMDLRTGGWFRYWPTAEQDPDTGASFAFNEVDSDGNLWAFPASHLDGHGTDFPADTDQPIETAAINQCLIYRRFDLHAPTNAFSWRSQPLSRTRNRYLDFRQIVMVASGVGRVKVTLYGLEAQTQTVTFDVAGSKIQLLQTAIGLDNTTDVELLIESEAGDPSLPAPTVHRVSLGYRDGNSIPDTGSGV